MTTKQTKSKGDVAAKFSTLEPLLKTELVSALVESTSVQQMELIEWLATETPEERSELEVPLLIKRLTPLQQKTLVESVTASMPKDVGTGVRLRTEGDVKEFNVQEWLDEKG